MHEGKELCEDLCLCVRGFVFMCMRGSPDNKVLDVSRTEFNKHNSHPGCRLVTTWVSLTKRLIFDCEAEQPAWTVSFRVARRF